jgi:tyrosyl-tRNA synthetase
MHPFLQESQDRGFIYQATDLQGLDHFLKTTSEPKAYIGFDATAPSLQVGNLVSVMWLRLMQSHGIRPIIVLGGATTQIGDPSFRDESRRLLPLETIRHNLQRFKETFQKFVRIETGEGEGLLLNNADWILPLNYIQFLRDYGSHLTLNRMLSFESVRLRLEREQPLTFLEFNYMILQAYDFLHLSRQQNCWIQMGGSDQWGNIVNGVELIRRLDQKTAFGLTSPLITLANGTKMGKTASGAVWVHPDSTSPYDYWQFWRNTDDRDVIRYLKIFTDISLKEIESLSTIQGSALNEVKKILADKTTEIAHGSEILPSIHQSVYRLFETRGTPRASVDFLSPEDPLVEMEGPWPQEIGALLAKNQLVNSKGEAKRLIQGRGVSLDGRVLEDAQETITLTDQPIRLSLGKKKVYWIRRKRLAPNDC